MNLLWATKCKAQHISLNTVLYKKTGISEKYEWMCYSFKGAPVKTDKLLESKHNFFNYVLGSITHILKQSQCLTLSKTELTSYPVMVVVSSRTPALKAKRRAISFTMQYVNGTYTIAEHVLGVEPMLIFGHRQSTKCFAYYFWILVPDIYFMTNNLF